MCHISHMLFTILFIRCDCYLFAVILRHDRGAFHCQQLVMVAWAIAFYILENCRIEIKDSEFDARIFQVSPKLYQCSHSFGMISYKLY